MSTALGCWISRSHSLVIFIREINWLKMLLQLLSILLSLQAATHSQLIAELLEPTAIFSHGGPVNLQHSSFCLPHVENSANCLGTTSCYVFKHPSRSYSLMCRFTGVIDRSIPPICCLNLDDSGIGLTINAPMTRSGTYVYLPRVQGNVNTTVLDPRTHVSFEGRSLQSRSGPLLQHSFRSLSNESSSNEFLKTNEREVGARQIKDIRLFLPTECGVSNQAFRRIVGGQESELGAWPWMAAIYLARHGLKGMECGGALVSAKHVVTAAHCVVDPRRGTMLPPEIFIVRLGDHNIESEEDGATPIDVRIRSVTRHENFMARTFQNDIAILELEFPVEFGKFISPICLPYEAFENDDLAGRNAFVTGWGTLSFDGPSSPVLQEVQIRIWNNEDCEQVFLNEVPISDANVCAGDGDKDACRGDSGGPLMLPNVDGKFYLVGIVSFGKKCAEPGIPGVYTRVSAFLDFISDVIISTSGTLSNSKAA